MRDKLRQRVNLYAMKEERTIEPETFCHLVSSTLYERRCVSLPLSLSLSFLLGTLFSEASLAVASRRRAVTLALMRGLLISKCSCRCAFARGRFGPYFVEPVVAGATSPLAGSEHQDRLSDMRPCAHLFCLPPQA